MMIHGTALISPKANLAQDVEVGPYSIIHENVRIGKGTKIGAFCEIGVQTALAHDPILVIGEYSVVRSHSVIYAGSKIGAKFTTGHHVCVRENSEISEGVQLGSRGDIQGDCSVGSYTKMHADVHIGKNSKIGSFVWLFPEVLLTNDPIPPSDILVGPVIEDFCVLASKVLVMPAVTISKNSVIAAGSIVKNNILEGKLAAGSPAKTICDARILRMPDNPREKAYPWCHRFQRGYPYEVVEAWISDASNKVISK